MSKALSVLATVAMAFAVIALYYNGGLLSSAPIVITLQIMAVLLMIWARLTFGWRSFHFAANPTEGGLVTSGPYRYVRNPIYSAVLLLVWSGVAAHEGLVNILLGLLATICAAIRIISEERLLRAHFADYEDYARKTRRLIPFVL